MNSSKTLEMEGPAATRRYTIPELIKDAEELTDILRAFDTAALADLMGVSPKLARLNVTRYQQWHTPFSLRNAKQALTAFKGDVFSGMAVDTYSGEDFSFAQSHIRIMSGLYGILRPLDLIQPYRLEMATRLMTNRGTNLYSFWENRITRVLKQLVKKEKSSVLINLASQEYIKSIKLNELNAHVITPVFQEIRDGKPRTIVIYTKKARGLMCDEIIRKRIKDEESLKGFKRDGYRFNHTRSSAKRFVFERNR
jgi:cytoplasmic iron level regulating protein YaaA (DUF328/UPF0246 family)